MFAFRLTQHGGNANSESCHRNILGGRLCVWTTSSSLPSLALLLLRLPSFFGTGLLTAPPLRNGKSNIFAYEMSEKSKHDPDPCRIPAERTGEPGDFRLRRHHILNDSAWGRPHTTHTPQKNRKSGSKNHL